MVLGKLPVPGRPTIWITVGQVPTEFELKRTCHVIVKDSLPYSPLPFEGVVGWIDGAG